jgi:DNA-binding transcriptional regulator GbsR (MarR family)
MTFRATVLTSDQREFIDEMGLLLAEEGGTLLHGRILALLLLCEPAHLSLTEMAGALTVSKGALSMTTRQLEAANLLVRVPVPGRRGVFYKLRDKAWERSLDGRIRATRRLREHAARGLQVASSASAKQRLGELIEFYAFVEQGLPEIIAAWRRSKEP